MISSRPSLSSWSHIQRKGPWCNHVCSTFKRELLRSCLNNLCVHLRISELWPYQLKQPHEVGIIPIYIGVQWRVNALLCVSSASGKGYQPLPASMNHLSGLTNLHLLCLWTIQLKNVIFISSAHSPSLPAEWYPCTVWWGTLMGCAGSVLSGWDLLAPACSSEPRYLYSIVLGFLQHLPISWQGGDLGTYLH